MGNEIPWTWIGLALLAIVLVMCVLSTLAQRLKGEIDRHNLLRQCRERRDEYQQALAQRQTRSPQR